MQNLVATCNNLTPEWWMRAIVEQSCSLMLARILYNQIHEDHRLHGIGPLHYVVSWALMVSAVVGLGPVFLLDLTIPIYHIRFVRLC